VAAVKVKNLPLALTLQKNQEPFQYEIFQCLACYNSHEEGREPAGLTSHGRRVQVARPLKNQKKLVECNHSTVVSMEFVDSTCIQLSFIKPRHI
jgi:hypothetical protein